MQQAIPPEYLHHFRHNFLHIHFPSTRMDLRYLLSSARADFRYWCRLDLPDPSSDVSIPCMSFRSSIPLAQKGYKLLYPAWGAQVSVLKIFNGSPKNELYVMTFLH